MPTAVREVDLSGPLRDIEGLGAAARCMLILRWRSRVIGRAFVPVHHSRLAADEIGRAIKDAAKLETLQSWLEGQLSYDERLLTDAATITASVVICTRDRPDDLRNALAAVLRLVHKGHEVIVVDNAPTSDATARVVTEFPNVRYVREPRPGLDVARNRGVHEAKGAIVAFTDDDAIVEPEWLDALLVNFSDSRVMCATGLTLPLELETEAQELFEEHCSFCRGFRHRTFDGQSDNPLAVGPVGAGANMAIRREVLTLIGGFNERLDAGTAARSGGDHEMFVRILSAGYRIVYDPTALSWHRHRRTRAEVFHTVFGYGVGVYAMWTGLLLEKRELGVLRLAWRWFRHEHLPALLSGWRRSSRSDRTDLRRAELRGCLYGPRAWLAARRFRNP
jgi:GT2 family glycosyltransferase